MRWVALASMYLAVGNGGWSGAINYTAMGNAVRRGYATSSTDTGHQGLEKGRTISIC
jgi:tannase/feruloyl esterase